MKDLFLFKNSSIDPLGLKTYINFFLNPFLVGIFERINSNLPYHSDTLSRIHQSNFRLLEGLVSP